GPGKNHQCSRCLDKRLIKSYEG
ncbi:unnamed protein product, partial [Allacma fusca]